MRCLIYCLIFLSSIVSASTMAQELRPYAPGTPQFGLGGTPERPAMAILRSDEDWSWLAGVDQDEYQALDHLKYVPVGSSSGYFSFAVNARVRMELFENALFGLQPDSDTSLHTRFDPMVSYTANDRLRLFGALKFANVDFERFPASDVDEQGLDVHQAFAEFSMGHWFGLTTHDLFARVGRQELHYGSGRILTIRDGPNVRRDFDGVMIRSRLGAVTSELLAFRPTQDEAGAFDNATNDDQSVWGVYTSTDLAKAINIKTPSHLDVYYFGQQRETSRYAYLQQSVEETRHTIGLRLWSAAPPTQGLTYDIEAAFQIGKAQSVTSTDDDVSIHAGFIAGDINYGFDYPWQPVVSIRLGASTGDSNPDDDRIETYRPLYPSGRYFSDAVPLGPGNIAEFSPSLTVTPIRPLSVVGRVRGFWRVDDNDGLYIVAEQPIRGPQGNDHYIGTEYSLIVTYHLSAYLTLDTMLSHIDSGDYLEDNLPDENTNYFRVSLDAAF